ncbi:MAG TPA: signal peptide peptidase SppA [Desulfohalobiaceae bacterium]|nr:signal peptide peptidase SppA [Desulfohalobiaceae bacterium]
MNKLKFSQKHPFLFGLFLIFTVVVLIIVAMAVFTFWIGSDGLSFGRQKLGVVTVKGTISKSNRINAWIEKLARDDDIHGVIVRVNSPGGGVAPSQEIYAAIARLAKKKPVVVSMGSVAASGGYYIACAADKIVANPGTITGSIGVKAQLVNLKKLMQKLGIQDETLTSGPYKDTGSPSHPLSPKEKAYMQNLIDDLYEQFVQDVAKGRHLEIKHVRKLADGRAYTGRQAKEYGLVDQLGGMNQAVELVRSLAGLKGPITLVKGPEEKFSLLSFLLGLKNKLVLERDVLGPQWVFEY